MKIGIFGGTFSPVHNGHIASACEFVKQMELDKLYIMPNNVPPHKSAVDGANSQERFDMLRLAFDGIDKIFVSDLELKREGKSYTVDTLEALAHEGELYMLCGSDMFLSLESWRRYEDIFKLANIVLGRRESDLMIADTLKNHKEHLIKCYSARVYEIFFDPFEISSSEIRECVKKAESIKGYVPFGVEKYICENKLYI